MTTLEIANKYYELANQRKWVEILDELYTDNALCIEPEHAAARGLKVVTEGREAIKAKGDAHRAKIETLHSRYCSEPLVTGKHFSMILQSDVTFKNQPRTQLEEIGVFEVKDGKIISEKF